MSYRDNVVEKRIASEVLKVPEDDSWNVVDVDGDLALCHFRHGVENKYNVHIRGTIIDIKNKCVVCSSFDSDTVIVSERIAEDNLNYILDDGTQLSKDESELYRGMDGVVVRVFKYNGKVYLSNYKKIDIVSSGAKLISTPYSKLYSESGGPDLNSFYASDKDYSPWVYTFIIVHPELINVSKIPIFDSGKVFFLNSNKLWNKDNSPFPIDKVDFDISKGVNFKITPEISVKNANEFLHTGYYPVKDSRYKSLEPQSRPGEYVALYHRTVNKKVPTVYLIHSKAYNNRYRIKKSNPYLKFRFYQLTNYARNGNSDPKCRTTYDKMFPKLTSVDIKNLKANIDTNYITYLPSDPNKSLKTFMDRLENIWLNFVLAVPLNQQKYALGLLDTYLQDQQMVTKWICNLYHQKGYNRDTHPLRVKVFMDTILKKTRYGSKNISYICWSLVSHETGASLYYMAEAMKIEMEAEKKNTVEAFGDLKVNNMSNFPLLVGGKLK
uniref:RNA ligase with polynucleotide kinase domain n=1 Tax=Pithovirus LCPAC001 TaxID=2506585 RepID=A0A481Z1C0_9VIRU|nr:MAG: RNA ligase with polynucleotide kinase domain [Pithovirus LCPAC001]